MRKWLPKRRPVLNEKEQPAMARGVHQGVDCSADKKSYGPRMGRTGEHGLVPSRFRGRLVPAGGSREGDLWARCRGRAARASSAGDAGSARARGPEHTGPRARARGGAARPHTLIARCSARPGWVRQGQGWEEARSHFPRLPPPAPTRAGEAGASVPSARNTCRWGGGLAAEAGDARDGRLRDRLLETEPRNECRGRRPASLPDTLNAPQRFPAPHSEITQFQAISRQTRLVSGSCAQPPAPSRPGTLLPVPCGCSPTGG